MKSANLKPLKTILISLISISLLPISVSADDGNTLFFYSKSLMTPIKISLDDLNIVTFSNDGIQMRKQNSIVDIPFEDFLLFTFKEIDHPYIADVKPPFYPLDLHIRYLEDQGTLLIESGQPLNGVCVYNHQGQIVTSDDTDRTHYSITLPFYHTGIYLVKIICDGKVYVNKIII